MHDNGFEAAVIEAAADDIEQIIQDTPPRLNPVNKTYTCADGTIIQLTGAKITSLTIERIASEGKPSIPMVEVTIGGRQKSVEYHHNDPGYKAMLEQWHEAANMRTLRYLFNRGVANQPTPEFITETLEWFPNASTTDLQYLYVAHLVPDSDIDGLTEAIMGYAMATVKGLAHVADSFPGHG